MNLLKLNNCQLQFLRILNYSYFDLDFDLVCLHKSRAVCTNFLDFMDSPSQTYMKWPLGLYSLILDFYSGHFRSKWRMDIILFWKLR